MENEILLVVPTLNAGSLWSRWIDAYNNSAIHPDCLVIDSSSSDKTVDLARINGFEVISIDKGEFNHGGTRNIALEFNESKKFVLFLTQDAILSGADSIEKIFRPFQDPDVFAVYGRQLPRVTAGCLETHSRLYNYPEASHVRSIVDTDKFGVKTAFLSNSFAAYRIGSLKAIGGFPDNVIFGEDMYVAAKFLKAGQKIAYAADACVYHSHDYSLWQEMKRYFDMGVFHARAPWIRQELGGAEGEGLKFVMSEQRYLFKHAFWRVPEGLLRTVLRYLGFRLGLIEIRLPLWLKYKLAMNKGYFKG